MNRPFMPVLAALPPPRPAATACPPRKRDAAPSPAWSAQGGDVVAGRYLYEQFTNFSGDGPMEWTDGSLGRAVAWVSASSGSRAEGSVFLRGEVLRSFDSWLAVSRSIVMPRVLFDPPYVETTWLDVPATVTMTSLELVVPTRVTVWRLQPYAVVGVGGKHYHFGEPTTANDVDAILPHDGFTWGADSGPGSPCRAGTSPWTSRGVTSSRGTGESPSTTSSILRACSGGSGDPEGRRKRVPGPGYGIPTRCRLRGLG